MSDPNGWVSNPPSQLVKIQNIGAKPELNGQMGVVVGFQEDRQRYVVISCIKQEQLSLKPDNLIKANPIDSARGQFQLLRHDPKIRQQCAALYQRIDTKLPGPIKPEYLAVLLLIGIMGAMVLVGVSKTILVLSLVILLAGLVAPDLIEGKSMDQIGRDLPQRLTATVRESLRDVPVVGKVVQNVPYAIPVLFLAMAAWVVRLLVFTPSAAAPTPPMQFTESTRGPPPAAMMVGMEEKYYKMGFEDASQGRDYGTNLPDNPTKASQPHDYSSSTPVLDDYYIPPHRSSSRLTMSSAMSLMYLGRAIYSLGQDGTGRWNPSRIPYNLQHQQPVQMGLLAFTVYRVVAAFLM